MTLALALAMAMTKQCTSCKWASINGPGYKHIELKCYNKTYKAHRHLTPHAKECKEWESKHE